LKIETPVTIDIRTGNSDIGGVDRAGVNLSDLQMTNHAMERSQQRCIPPLIIHWLCQYGSRKRGNNGTILCYFDRKSLRLIASEAGHIVVRRLSSLMNAYLVIAGNQILTVGHRYKRIKNF